jgi:hypothetical protein
MKCPKCEHDQENTIVCESCGIYFIKYLSLVKNKNNNVKNELEKRIMHYLSCDKSDYKLIYKNNNEALLDCSTRNSGALMSALMVIFIPAGIIYVINQFWRKKLRIVLDDQNKVTEIGESIVVSEARKRGHDIIGYSLLCAIATVIFLYIYIR